MIRTVLFLSAVAAATPVLAQNSQTSPRVEGRFRGTAPGYNQELAIQRVGEDRYSVSVSVNAPGCKGSMQGTGTIQGITMVIKDAAGACTLSLMRGGPNVQIDVESCSGYTGASCDFGGTYARR